MLGSGLIELKRHAKCVNSMTIEKIKVEDEVKAEV